MQQTVHEVCFCTTCSSLLENTTKCRTMNAWRQGGKTSAWPNVTSLNPHLCPASTQTSITVMHFERKKFWYNLIYIWLLEVALWLKITLILMRRFARKQESSSTWKWKQSSVYLNVKVHKTKHICLEKINSYNQDHDFDLSTDQERCDYHFGHRIPAVGQSTGLKSELWQWRFS